LHASNLQPQQFYLGNTVCHVKVTLKKELPKNCCRRILLEKYQRTFKLWRWIWTQVNPEQKYI